jgi:hypothetical protein
MRVQLKQAIYNLIVPAMYNSPHLVGPAKLFIGGFAGSSAKAGDKMGDLFRLP